jgi:hypothetical protein
METRPIPLAILVSILAHGLPAQEAPSQGPPAEVSRAPHPYLQDPPAAFARLIDRGKVSIQVNDQKLREAKKSALTVFEFEVRQKLNYRFRYADRPSKGKFPLRLSVRFEDTTLEVKHTLFLPTWFHPRKPWESTLLRHEMDHVAISTDPRMWKLVESTLWQPESWVEVFEAEVLPSNEEIERAVQSRADLRRMAVESLIQAYYDQLDQLSRDGRDPIEDRKGFFESLYMRDSLRGLKFTYLDNALRMVGTSSYADIGQHYSLLTSP